MNQSMKNNGQQIRYVSRRDFLLGSAAAAISISTLSWANPFVTSTPKRQFKLKYAPHFGMFRSHAGEDLLDQLRFMVEEGFTALEDNGMMGRSKKDQEKIAREMQKLNMSMGVFVAYGEFQEKTFVTNDTSVREMLINRMKETVEVAKRVHARWTTVVPGAFDNNMEWDYQTAHVVENLKWCADVFEPADLVMVLEPLNPWRDHPGLFLTKIPQAYQICRAVNSPSCKILDDLYHQQITEGNLIPNIDKAWDEIAYFQVGDNPGRKEPTTGEINYKNVFKHILQKGYSGIIGMEHGNFKKGKEGERAVINAYIECDNF